MSAEDSLPVAPTSPPPRYGAFISYSHHDKLVARRLQRQLETYRVPKRLVGRATPQGPVPARLSPLFRDRDELNAGADLKASVQEALAASRWLIVVCSPDAARSPWVNREIIEFKRLHGEGRVLALIAAGEPFASNTPGREASECFPPALRFALTADGRAEGEPLEPIAADQRAEGDGPRRAALKLLAGMVGVGFDDLVQRDTQRRLRWLAGIASASAVGVVVFALLAVLAVRARNEAQHQRAQAEGLIEFMLGDLRKKLEPVGRLEVLDSVGEKALAYYGAQEADQLDATALGHRSRAMHLIGEIRDLRGNPAEAQAAFEQAAATTQRLVAQFPHDGQRIFDHSQSMFWVGYAAWKRADGKTAEAKFRSYLELSERLTKLDPSNVDWQAEEAFAYVNLGAVQLGTERPAEAIASLEAAGTVLKRLLPQRADLGFELAQNHGFLSSAHEQLGQYEAALKDTQQQLALFRAMPGGTKNKVAQRGIVSALNTISRHQLDMGDPAAAQASGRDSLAIAERLVEEDPTNLFWRGDACFARLRMVEVDRAMGRAAEAASGLAATIECARGLDGVSPASPRYSVDLKGRALAYSAVLAPVDRPALVSQLAAYLAVSSAVVAKDTLGRVNLTVVMANAAETLGNLQADGDPAAAREAWARAAELLQPFAGLNDGSVLTTLARVRLRLGDREAARQVVDRIQRTSYRHPAYLDLVNQLDAARGGNSAKGKKTS